jgi:lactocepin
VSGEIEYGQIDELEHLRDVDSVQIVNEYERPTEKPEMIASKEMVQAIQTWNAGFDGRGMVIGIIDTGIDYTHKDMVLTEDAKNKLSATKVNQLVKDNNLPGMYYSLKVPYGHNYADKNDNILDQGPDASMHGMHVAGTVGANGDESKGGIKGVAPNAQLLALKVFGNDPAMPSTFGDIYVKAIDDGIKLGADVMNMSLGSTAGFVSPDSMEQKAIQRATDSGVLMSISAGNSDQIGSGTKNPFASNPDIGLVGAPGLASSSISVASIENNKITLDQMKVKIGSETLPIAYKRQSSPNPLEVFGTKKELDLVYAGDGSPAKYTGLDVKGKVVFVVRANSNPNYAEIQKAAEAAGAAGVIIRGHVSHGDYVSMALQSPTIPLVSLGISDGNMLESKIKAVGGTGKVTFTGDMTTVANTTAGKMSTFTSWGVTPSLELKPELTAPGGQIYSTLNDDKYGIMSGTSMAAPHVSGGSALVLQKVQQLFPDLQGADKVKRAKTLLMNTAKPVQDPDDNNLPYSPRRQGAGLMQLHSAINTPVYVVRKGTQDAKVELKEITSDKFEMTVTATNFSNKDVTYNVNASVLTDSVSDGRNDLKTKAISDAVVKTDTPSVTLFPGQSKDITVRVDLTNAKAALEAAMKNGYFVEGYITLTNGNQDAALPDISVPYVGFKGDWNAAPAVDATRYDTDSSYYNFSAFVDQNGSFMGKNPFTGLYQKEKLAISPNGDGNKDAIAPVLQFLRNSKTVEYSITDVSGKRVRLLRTDKDQRKDYFAAKTNYTYKPQYTEWDGLINNKVAPEGKYYYQIKTQVDYPGKEAQVVKFPVIVDNTAPIVSDTAYSKKNNIVSFIAKDNDNGSGLDRIDIKVDGVKLGSVNPEGKTSFSIYLGPKAANNSVEITATDNAGNTSVVAVSSPGDNTIPYIITDNVKALGAYNTREIPLTGHVTDGSRVDYLKVRSDKLVGGPQTLKLVYNPTTKQYDFATQLKFSDDGVQDIYFEGADVVGNKIEFRRQIFIDTIPATIDITDLPKNNFVATGSPDPKVTVTVSDNWDDIRLQMNGDELYSNQFDQPFEQRPLTHEEKVTLPLKDGKNDFEFKVTDLGGHVTKKTISIFKGANPPAAFITSFNVTPDNNVSADSPAVITAEASDKINWDVKVIDPNGKVINLNSEEGQKYNGTFTPDASAVSGKYTIVLSPKDGTEADKEEMKIVVNNHPISVDGAGTFDANGKTADSFKNSTFVSIKGDLKNVGQTITNPTVIVQVKDKDGAVAYISEVNIASINKGALNRFSLDIPLEGFSSGSYTVEVLVWDSLLKALPLADSSNIGFFTVN